MSTYVERKAMFDAMLAERLACEHHVSLEEAAEWEEAMTGLRRLEAAEKAEEEAVGVLVEIASDVGDLLEAVKEKGRALRELHESLAPLDSLGAHIDELVDLLRGSTSPTT
jgi:hypothetical protein